MRNWNEAKPIEKNRHILKNVICTELLSINRHIFKNNNVIAAKSVVISLYRLTISNFKNE